MLSFFFESPRNVHYPFLSLNRKTLFFLLGKFCLRSPGSSIKCAVGVSGRNGPPERSDEGECRQMLASVSAEGAGISAVVGVFFFFR